jgi:hypothetical protein
MILSAMQPCYLPWLGFFNKIVNSDLFVLLDDCQYEKGSYINRVQIKTAQGAHWLTIPVPRDSYKKKIKDVEICSEDFRDKHRIIIHHNYRKAEYYGGGLMYLNTDNISLFNSALIDMTLRILGAECTIEYQSACGISGTKQDLIINLCKHYNADAFLFGAKGRDYVDVDYFKSQGIEPLFQDFKCIEYPQQWGGGFIPGLSVIDALFNVGPEKTLELIKGGYSVR